ncbi:hypothetical protein ASPCADRAFT_54566 [Aspergillus carbonarius ITEM 5010]|uniref:hydroxymethylglutaryl-CoA reductase (NADPH) n=1 Tax=Aspergillus carbonarius (strain ITEM 5010) TaxID=602072 RepID=A0A1R3RDY8_ASPC5|nr:hypothetical protein ASPCADRAFT_54566 [Aspergillus carbonarius ITEM 5010]
MAPPSDRTKAKFGPYLSQVEHITRHDQDPFEVKIENFIGYTHVPIGLAGPLHVRTPAGSEKEICAPMATTEAALVASCCRGCKAVNACGGVEFVTGEDSMKRCPFFRFQSPGDAFKFVHALPQLKESLTKVAETTSKHLRLQSLTPHTVGRCVHVLLSFACGDASGQNMVTIATEHVCAWVLRVLRSEYGIVDTYVEGQMSSDKKPSWGNVTMPRGVEVTAWTSLPDSTCQKILGCSSATLHDWLQTVQEGAIRNGQHGSSINVANVLAAIFIATGQDAASITDACWAHLTPEYDRESQRVTLSLYLPSLPVGVVGGGTAYATQREALRIMQCDGPGGKHQLAGCIAAFALALEISTASSIITKTFAQSHERLARWEAELRPRPRM